MILYIKSDKFRKVERAVDYIKEKGALRQDLGLVMFALAPEYLISKVYPLPESLDAGVSYFFGLTSGVLINALLENSYVKEKIPMKYRRILTLAGMSIPVGLILLTTEGKNSVIKPLFSLGGAAIAAACTKTFMNRLEENSRHNLPFTKR